MELETKILRHYYMEEIGLETVALWKLRLEEKLILIMPYYNKMYETTVKDYDYMVDVDVTEDFTGNETRQEDSSFRSNETNELDSTEDETANSTLNIDSNITTDVDSKTTGRPTSHTSHNDFPQAPLEQNKGYGTYEDYTQNVTDEANNTNTLQTTDDTEHTSNTAKATKTSNQEVDYNSSNNLTGNKDNTHQLHRKGLTGSRSFTELLIQYRNSLINIDNMIIKELGELFMTIY